MMGTGNVDAQYIYTVTQSHVINTVTYTFNVYVFLTEGSFPLF